MQGNLDIFLDTNIPGCIECHLYLYPCDLAVPRTYPICPEPLTEYPESVDEILRTQAMRYGQMRSIHHPLFPMDLPREAQCKRFRGSVEVSRYSIV
ncbi:hypothetical protein PIIN_09979 [Serendipita indica DSM 11827]|uniref:Uncharacterized protein n=1 Tax=Serendipita indica (strain DSM 11827) TaxID=1109443 RepID=G4TXD6_SERID|nr:hypothetical protein PIIN_09979 [Serendipita indica DSM 11827]